MEVMPEQDFKQEVKDNVMDVKAEYNCEAEVVKAEVVKAEVVKAECKAEIVEWADFKVKEEEPLEQAILSLLDRANAHNDEQAAIRLIQVEALLLEQRTRHEKEIVCCKLEDEDGETTGKPLSPIQDVVEDSSTACPDDGLEESGSTPSKTLENQNENKQHDKPFLCSECPYRASEKNKLRRHEVIHSDSKPFACKMCSFTTRWKEYLKSHEATVHTEKSEKAFSCTECPFKTASKGYLKTHLFQVHSGKKPFSCTKCSYRCAMKGSLKASCCRRVQREH